MKILVINAGSSSLKFQLFDMDTETILAKGNCECIGLTNSFLKYKAKGMEKVIEQKFDNHTQAIELVLKTIVDPEIGVIKSLDEVNAIGHRILHGGTKFKEATLITEDVMKTLETLIPLGPLHMPANINGVKSCQEVMPGKPNVALFDTGFHSSMPDYAYTYAVPYEWLEKYNVRRYGFHGMSHDYISRKVAEITGRNDLKIINCHIGNGASVCAIKNGKCVDTSMGLTPLEGLVMGTRCGDMDLAVAEYMMQQTGMDIKEFITACNKKSGLLGVSGVSSDIRDVNKAIEAGDYRAKLSVDIFNYRIKKYIGSYAAAMGGVDVIVFTAGSGENRDEVREAVMKDMEFLGVDFDFEANRNFTRGEINLISKPTSKVAVYVIPTDEELVIARDTMAVVSK